MIFSVVILGLVISHFGVDSIPVSKQAYENQYYANPQQYLQENYNQPQYISVPPIPQAPTPIYVGPQQQPQPPPPSRPTQVVSQLLLPSAADRQVQKAAEQLAGPEYAQQVQFAQQQGLANEAVATAQRRAQAQVRRAQQLAQQQAQQYTSQTQQYTSQAQQYIQQQQPQQYISRAALQQAQQYASQSAQQQQYLRETPNKPQYVQIQIPQHVQPQQYQTQYAQQQQQQRAAYQQQQQHQQQQQQQEKEQEPEEEHDVNSAYQFGFDIKDDEYTNYQNRKEQREGGKISGKYSVVDSDGYIRTVTYTADPKEGFKADVVREPTDIVVKVPQPKPQQQEITIPKYAQQKYQVQPKYQQQQHVIYQ